MILTMVGVTVVVVAGYIGRKGWLKFHRAVGITPGKLVYTDPSKLPSAPLIQLPVSCSQLQELPYSIREQLQRIDTKADIYQQWQNELIESGKTPVATEGEFVVSKLLHTRLPEMLKSYQRIARHDARLQHPMNPNQSNNQSNLDNSTTSTVPASSLNKGNAQDLLVELLNKIECKLDSLLESCQYQSINEMQAMRRYLDERQ